MRSIDSRVADAIASAYIIEEPAELQAARADPLPTADGEWLSPLPEADPSARRAQLYTQVLLDISPLEANEVAVAHGESLGQVLYTAHQQLNWKRTAGMARRSALHEERHLSGAVGMDTEARIAIYRDGYDGEYFIAPTAHAAGRITFMGYLAVLAAPFDLSPGDKADLAIAGYPNISDLRSTIIEHNERAKSNEQIPIPPNRLLRGIHITAKAFAEDAFNKGLVKPNF